MAENTKKINVSLSSDDTGKVRDILDKNDSSSFPLRPFLSISFCGLYQPVIPVHRRGGGFLFFWFSSVFFGFLLVFFWFSSGFLPVFFRFSSGFPEVSNLRKP